MAELVAAASVGNISIGYSRIRYPVLSDIIVVTPAAGNLEILVASGY